MQYRSQSNRNFKNVGEEYDEKDILCSIFYRNLKNQNCHLIPSKTNFVLFYPRIKYHFPPTLEYFENVDCRKISYKLFVFSENLADLSSIFKRLIISNVEDSSLF